MAHHDISYDNTSYSIDYLECLNCGMLFTDDSPDFYDRPIHPIFSIPKGKKIGDIPCPVCGCRTLYRG